MFNGFCHFGNWGSRGNFGIWGWVGMILNLIFWVGWLAALVLWVVLLIRRARMSPATIPQVAG
jgi:hypothetical protein